VRDAERAARRVTAFTDARSAKAAELAADPRAALTWYAAERQIQLRGWARARLHAGDARTRACWEALPPVLRAVYGGAPGPGAPIGAAGSGRPAFDGPPSAEAVEPGYAHFVVLDLTLERIEWLRLRPEGNLSARFVWDGDGGPAATWIVP
jgi:pyridoxamine 5'-phosphate oxidase